MVTSININATESKDEMTTNNDSSSVPSGFVLKLYQMVNEAPDDIIAVSRSILRCVCHFLHRNVACNEIFEFFGDLIGLHIICAVLTEKYYPV